MTSITPALPAQAPCAHGPFIDLQNRRILELADTLAALKDKFDAVSEVNTKFEVLLEREAAHRREYALNNAKQTARTETLIEEIQKARARENVLARRVAEMEAELASSRGRESEQVNKIASLETDLAICRATEAELRESNGILHGTIDEYINEIDDMLATHRRLVAELTPILTRGPRVKVEAAPQVKKENE